MMLSVADDSGHRLAVAFTRFVNDTAFPCVGAKAAVNRGGMRFVVARDFRSAWDDLRILPTLMDLAKDYRASPGLFRSLVVLFEAGAPSDEEAFEAQLWTRLESLTAKDQWLGQPADPRVSHDPDDPHFALSFGGEAFFVVGLHPRASRPARRFAVAAMVFNLHDQFEQLRAQNRYDKLRASILDRDLAFAGSANPMIAAYGASSAARQYSGRAVSADWQCPFRGRSAANDQ